MLGQGSGKSAEAKAAVDKATRKALKHLTYVPRFRGHTVHYLTNVHFGKTKVGPYAAELTTPVKLGNPLYDCRPA